MTPPSPAPKPGGADPSSTLQERQREEGLIEAMTPVTERAIHRSVQREPEVLAEALFPIIGSAVRKAVANAFEKMMQAMNTAMEHSLSPQSIRWRIEAKRTGQSFAEIVLLRSLRYRVEQVFLIEKRGGLLLQHVTVDPAMSEHREVISSMLTAIQDFMRDSFHAEEDVTQGTVELGGVTLWIEIGPSAVLAASIDGTPPQQLRELIQTTLGAIQKDHLAPLAVHTSDPEAFASCVELMKACLLEQQPALRAKPAASYTPLFWIVLGVAILLSIWFEFALWYHVHWGRYETQLRAEPGIVVLDATVRGSHFYVTGLRDKRASDPREIARERDLPVEKLHLQLAPFQSTDERLPLPPAR